VFGNVAVLVGAAEPGHGRALPDSRRDHQNGRTRRRPLRQSRLTPPSRARTSAANRNPGRRIGTRPGNHGPSTSNEAGRPRAGPARHGSSGPESTDSLPAQASAPARVVLARAGLAPAMPCRHRRDSAWLPITQRQPPQPWASEHDRGKYLVRSRLEPLIGLAFAQVEGAGRRRWGHSLADRTHNLPVTRSAVSGAVMDNLRVPQLPGRPT
jgi:hypothetical protein